MPALLLIYSIRKAFIIWRILLFSDEQTTF